MAVIRTSQVVDYGDEEFEPSWNVVSPPWEAYPYPTSGDTFTLRNEGRHRGGRHGTGQLENEFIARILAVQRLWRDRVTAGEKAGWKTAAKLKAAARPDMKEPPPNGFALFAEVAMAFVAAGIPEEALRFTDTTHEPDYLTFEDAYAPTGTLDFSLDFDNPAHVNENIFVFIHQVDPAHVDKRDADRRTYQVGYYQVEAGGSTFKEFIAQAAWPFATGDVVQVLIRVHRSLSGVTNYLLAKAAD